MGKCSQIKRFIIIAIIFFLPRSFVPRVVLLPPYQHTHTPLYQNKLSIPTHTTPTWYLWEGLDSSIFVSGAASESFEVITHVYCWIRFKRPKHYRRRVFWRDDFYLNTYELYSVYIVLNNIYKSRLPRLHVAGKVTATPWAMSRVIKRSAGRRGNHKTLSGSSLHL